MDTRGSMGGLREQQSPEVMVNVERPFEVLTNLARKEWNNWSDVPVQMRKDIERFSREPARPISATNGATLS